jgi:hypothetical protein
MDILNSGSFVPLDNKERMEQLAFTAKTLAIEVSRAEGFQSSGSTNHQLGLEMWKGAEYVCRAHEEANIKNIFLSKFLETLRGIERQSAVQPNPVQTQVANPPTAHPPVLVQTQVATSPTILPDPVPVPVSLPLPEVVPEQRPQEASDEYLGVISREDGIETERPSYAAECVPEFEAEIAAINNGLETEEIIVTAAGESNEDEPMEATPSKAPEAEAAAVTEAGNTDVFESSSTVGPVSEEPETAESPTQDIAAVIDSIVLSEKEPYNFDSCTITVVIQLLPENDGIRKGVVSVRSHDFVPQITISDISNWGVNEGLKQCLETALGQYRTNLPLLAAEKIKKQKPVSKKRTSKADDKRTKATSVSDAKTSVGSASPPAAQNSEAAKDQQNLFAS